ncbi:MAG: hypothetical protein AAGD86_09685 [Pseudomonadota bacterium]
MMDCCMVVDLEALPDLPAQARAPVVVMVTTSMNPADRDRAGTYEQVRGYLNKPLTLEQLKDIAARLSA